MRWLHRYTRLLAVASLLLITAGGLVTSTGSGLAVPDWPNTYGYFMFTFPLSSMVGGILYEHGHRLIASVVGMLTIGLALWLARVEPRRWVRRLGWIALVAVVVQGVLGGMTVLYFLPAPISISHAGLAQLFFVLIVSLAIFTSPGWHDHYRGRAAPGAGPRASAADPILARLAMILPAVIYVQILVGATMRHTGAGLAIPDVPLVFGGIVPPEWTGAIAIHYAHRVGAVLTTAFVFITAGHVLRHHGARRELARPSMLLAALVLIQVGLGGWTVLSERQMAINTAHVAVGALLLVTSVVLALRVHRAWFADAGEARHATSPAAADPLHRALHFLALTKPRLNTLVVASAGVGYWLGAAGPVDLMVTLHLLMGTALVAGSAAALNQVAERDIDRRMARTRMRPLPANRVTPFEARLFGALLGVAGLLELAVWVHTLAATVALATLLSYVWVYTPLKRRTGWATVIGAVPGALPPVIGWTAARGALGVEALVLFGIVFFWQMPHFHALSWLHRDDYVRSGLPLLAAGDPDGRRMARHALGYAAALVPVSLAPAVVGLAGMAYLALATLLGSLFVLLAILFLQQRSEWRARALFVGSLVYLPVLWSALLIGRMV